MASPFLRNGDLVKRRHGEVRKSGYHGIRELRNQDIGGSGHQKIRVSGYQGINMSRMKGR